MQPSSDCSRGPSRLGSSGGDHPAVDGLPNLDPRLTREGGMACRGGAAKGKESDGKGHGSVKGAEAGSSRATGFASSIKGLNIEAPRAKGEAPCPSVGRAIVKGKDSGAGYGIAKGKDSEAADGKSTMPELCQGPLDVALERLPQEYTDYVRERRQVLQQYWADPLFTQDLVYNKVLAKELHWELEVLEEMKVAYNDYEEILQEESDDAMKNILASEIMEKNIEFLKSREKPLDVKLRALWCIRHQWARSSPSETVPRR